jgi:hypothetical protein
MRNIIYQSINWLILRIFGESPLTHADISYLNNLIFNKSLLIFVLNSLNLGQLSGTGKTQKINIFESNWLVQSCKIILVILLSPIFYWYIQILALYNILTFILNEMSLANIKIQIQRKM